MRHRQYVRHKDLLYYKDSRHADPRLVLACFIIIIYSWILRLRSSSTCSSMLVGACGSYYSTHMSTILQVLVVSTRSSQLFIVKILGCTVDLYREWTATLQQSSWLLAACTLEKILSGKLAVANWISTVRCRHARFTADTAYGYCRIQYVHAAWTVVEVLIM